MKTKKPKLKTEKTRLNIQLSQTLTMNAAHDIKILDMYLQFGRGCNKKCFLESQILPNINRYPIYKEKKKIGKKTNENKTQFSLVKNQLMVDQNEQLL